MNNTNSPKVIGSTTLADIPQSAVFGIPAKVDTGADSSTIWSSNITEHDGVLSYELFAPGSPFYTGKTIKTRSFVIRSIRNSFGQTEFRYKVPIKIKLEGRLIVARFTLSDRSQNKYPMLIGRRTLSGKFVVDVNKKNKTSKPEQPKKVLVLLDKGGEKFDTFYAQINQEHRHELVTEIVRYSDLTYSIINGVLHVKNIQSGTDLSTYNLIYFKTSKANAEFASIVAKYARFNLVPYVDRAAENLAPDSKIHQLALLGLSGITVPDTVYISSRHIGKSFANIVSTLDLPFILKDNNGRKGRDNYLIKSQEEFDAAVSRAGESNIQMLAQRYVKNTGYYRVVVLGKQVPLVMFRPVDQQRSHLFNKKLDGPAQLLKPQDLPGDVIAMCIRAADNLGWQIAGVDVLQDKDDGKWYCLEVNNSPQLVSGAFIDEKRAALTSFFKQQMDI